MSLEVYTACTYSRSKFRVEKFPILAAKIKTLIKEMKLVSDDLQYVATLKSCGMDSEKQQHFK